MPLRHDLLSYKLHNEMSRACQQAFATARRRRKAQKNGRLWRANGFFFVFLQRYEDIDKRSDT